MSLPHTNWRYVGSASFTPASLSVVMNTIYDLGVSTTYHDNSSRTPGSGSAGTWEKVVVSNVTESVYVTPAGDTLASRIMIGGATYTPSPSPSMGPSETYSANALMANVVKNAGAFSQWNASSPFTSGQTFGWMRFWQTSNGAGTVHLWESKDCVAVLVSNSNGSFMYGFIGGAIIDPESDDTTTDAEADGKLYGLAVTGITNSIPNEFNSQGGFPSHSTTFGQNRAGVFSPGLGSVLTMQRMTLFTGGALTATRLKTRSGRFARVAIVMRADFPDNCLGRLRDIYAFTDAQVPARQTDGAGVIGYIFGASAANLSDCILLEH